MKCGMLQIYMISQHIWINKMIVSIAISSSWTVRVMNRH